jgi:hypothetical protein
MTQPNVRLASPTVAVSWGELIDKITILDIKAAELKSAQARANVGKELAQLNAVLQALAAPPALAGLKDQLARTNLAIWKVEDDIRAKENDKQFDAAFIELARSVYHLNDERARIKRAINSLLQSELVEEKGYTGYN